MTTKIQFPYTCDVDDCSVRGTFVSDDLKMVACTRHARKGFMVVPTRMEQAFGHQSRYYREGMGNLIPVSGMPSLQAIRDARGDLR